MKPKLNENNYSKLDFLINNFYEIVEFKRGRGVYGDRIILRRPKYPECIFGEKNKYYEFFYLDANDVKELPMTIKLRIDTIKRFIVNPECMNILCENSNSEKVIDWAFATDAELKKYSNDFSLLNDCLIERYKLLDRSFIEKLQIHRVEQYSRACSKEFGLLDATYAETQIGRL